MQLFFYLFYIGILKSVVRLAVVVVHLYSLREEISKSGEGCRNKHLQSTQNEQTSLT